MFPFLPVVMAPDYTVRASITAGASDSETTTPATATAPAGSTATTGLNLTASGGMDLIAKGAQNTDTLNVFGNYVWDDTVSQPGGTINTFSSMAAYTHTQPLAPTTNLMILVNGTLFRADNAVPSPTGATLISPVITSNAGWSTAASLGIVHDLGPHWALSVSGHGTVSGTLSATSVTPTQSLDGLNTVGGGLMATLTHPLSSISGIAFTGSATETDYQRVLNIVDLSGPLLEYDQSTAMLTGSYYRNLSYTWMSQSVAGAEFVSATPVEKTLVTPVASQSFRYTLDAFSFTAMAQFGYDAATVITPGGPAASLSLLSSGVLGTRPPLRDFALVGGLTSTYTFLIDGGVNGSWGSAKNNVANLAVRYAVSPLMGVVVGASGTYTQETSTTSSTIAAITVFAGLSGYISSLRMANPLTAVTSMQFAR